MNGHQRYLVIVAAAFLVGALPACGNKDAGTAPTASAAAAPTGPPTKVADKGLDIQPTGATDPNNHGYPKIKVTNTGKKAVKGYSYQIVVSDAAGDKVGESFPTSSPFQPIKPGASIETSDGTPESPGNKTTFVVWRIEYDDNTFYENQAAQDKRPKKAPGAASAAPSASAAASAAPKAGGGKRKK